MAFNQFEAIDRVGQAVLGRTPNPTESDFIVSLLGRGLQRLADSIAIVRRPDGIEMPGSNAPLLHKSYSLSLVSGVASLVSSTDLLIPSIKFGRLDYPNVNNTQVQWTENRNDLDLPRFDDLYRFTVYSNSIVMVDDAGDAPDDATLTLVSAHVLTIAELALIPQLIDNYIDEVSALYSESA